MGIQGRLVPLVPPANSTAKRRLGAPRTAGRDFRTLDTHTHTFWTRVVLNLSSGSWAGNERCRVGADDGRKLTCDLADGYITGVPLRSTSETLPLFFGGDVTCTSCEPKLYLTPPSLLLLGDGSMNP